jgi:DNA-directed RNA polymerase specialized sigma subunit
MAIFSQNKNTKRVLRDDVAFINRIIADASHLEAYPLTEKGHMILKMLWEEDKSFNQVAEKLCISKGRVIQIYRFEMRRLTYFLNSTFKEYIALQQENRALRKENKELKGNRVTLQIV